VYLYEGPDAPVLEAMRALAGEAGSVPTALLAFSEDLPALQGTPAVLEDLGSRSQPEVAAQRLYALFRDLDARGIDRIGVRLAPPGGLGDAVNDRLRRAASGRVRGVEG
jgi:L-threonylcarbamoyladenylate synthase